MDIIATQKFLLMSPKKLRLIADLARKMKPNEAVERLPYLNKRGAKVVAKVVATAIANAKNKGVSESDLIFKTLEINEGPRLKRGNPVSRGQWHPIKKRMSHIRVVLTTRSETKSSSESSKLAAKSETKKGGK
jgi:large subunit ribosomal protein L22